LPLCVPTASANGHLELIKFLVEQKQAKFTTTDSGNTPLHWSVQCKQLETSKYLLEAFDDVIDVFAQNSFGTVLCPWRVVSVVWCAGGVLCR
jgi:ankyrin repeat protein